MAPDVVHLANLMLAGILLGNELSTLAVVHPATRSLEMPAQVAMEKSLTKRYGLVMPVLMVATLVSGVAVAVGAESDGQLLAIAGTACIAVMLGVTFAGNMPVNVYTLRAGEDVDADEWRERRRTWTRWHALRVLLDAAAMACFVLAVLVEAG
jgi:uncharacterized membrane protein